MTKKTMLILFSSYVILATRVQIHLAEILKHCAGGCSTYIP